MNNNFEKEYRKKIQEEAPDLWNRIEEGLADKKADKQVLEFHNKTKRNKIIKFSSFAAACICLAIVLPVFIFTEKNYSDKISSTENIESVEKPSTIFEFEAAAEEESEVAEAATEESESASEEMSEETSAEEASVTETKNMKVTIQGYAQLENSFIYEMIVEEDNNDEFEAGTEIEMEVDESFVTNLENGKKYEIEFYYDSTKSVPYCLTDATEIQ